MKKTLSRSLSLLLAVVLAVSLALPAAAASVAVTGVTLDKTTLTLAPKDSYTLKATVKPDNATNQNLTWKSNRPDVATVSSKGVVTAVSEGTASILVTTNDGGYFASCDVTVAKSKVTSLTIDPAGPEVLPIGKTRTLIAKGNYSNGTTGTVDVSWSSNDNAVATVDKKGVVTAVAEGTTTIFALYREGEDNNSAVSATYQVTVSKSASTSKDDVLALSATTVNTNAGLFVESAVKAPAVTVKNGTTDVTEAYNITYLWTDASKKELGKDATLLLQPTTQADLLLTCTVTAASKTDSTQILTGTCTYGVKVYPSTSLGGVHSVAEGAVTLNKLMDLENKVSVIDQLVKGDDTGMAQPIAGLTHVVFDTNTITGSDAGTLSAKNGSEYYASTTADGDHLADVTFTPLKKGTFAINFLAYGDKVYYGRLEVLVDDAAVTPPTDDDVRQCDSTGFTFAGSDFYRDSDTDPVAAVVFGKPSAGHLLRNLSHGIGTADDGDKYYTNSASQGDYHVSTLSYLPDAGYMVQATIPVTYITAAGIETTGVIKVSVSTKTDSAQFKDVTRSNVGTWAADAVDFAYHFGLVSGVSKTEFAPNSPMTRAQLVTVLYRAAGSPSVTVSTNFEDLDVGSYYYSAVVWANVNGIVNGTSDTTFSPDSRLTRQQLAAILYRYARAFGGDTSYIGNLSHFTDRHQVDSYATTPMIWAVSHEIISGTSDTTLSPLSTATRAQVVVILHRYLTD